MQRAAAHQLSPRIHNREIADVFRHFKFGSRQHDAIRRVTVNQIQQRVDIAHSGLADEDLVIRVTAPAIASS